MTIDLSQFSENIKAVVPVVNNCFKFNRKNYILKNIEDGWYHVNMRDNKASVIEQAFVTEDDISQKTVLGYVHNNNIIFQNFDVGKRQFGLEIQAPLLLNTFDSFSAIRAVYWEDKNFYPVSVNYNDLKIFEVKSAFDDELPLNELKGITPELRMLYFFHEMQRKKFLEALVKAKAEQEKSEFLKSIPGRIETILSRVGGKLIGVEQNGNRVIVDWTLEDSRHEYNTVLNLTTMEVIEAGICMSGSDKDHNLTSLAITAREWEKEGRRDLIHITRHKGGRDYEDEDDYDDSDW